MFSSGALHIIKQYAQNTINRISRGTHENIWSRGQTAEHANDKNEDSMNEDLRNEDQNRDGGPPRNYERDANYDGYNGDPDHRSRSGQYRDEVYSKRVPAGKRTYFFDVKTTRSGEDYFLTITESKRVDEHRYEKHKIFLYKEDFGKFLSSMHEVVRFIQDECLPGYDFRGLPDVSANDGEHDEAYVGEGDSH